MRKIITISAAILSLGTFAATANAQTMIEGDMSGVPLVQYYNGGYGYGGYYNYKNSRDALDTCLYC